METLSLMLLATPPASSARFHLSLPTKRKKPALGRFLVSRVGTSRETTISEKGTIPEISSVAPLRMQRLHTTSLHVPDRQRSSLRGLDTVLRSILRIPC